LSTVALESGRVTEIMGFSNSSSTNVESISVLCRGRCRGSDFISPWTNSQNPELKSERDVDSSVGLCVEVLSPESLPLLRVAISASQNYVLRPFLSGHEYTDHGIH
jgi:hypothetical protein